MNRWFYIAASCCVLMLAGCASGPDRPLIQPIMHFKQTPEPNSGYVAGMFSRKSDLSRTGLGVGIVNTATAEEYVMPFGIEKMLHADIADEFDMVQLPPGEYRIAYWLDYASEDGTPIGRTSIAPDSMPYLSFKLVPGEVVFIGSYVAKMESSNGKATWAVRQQRLATRSVRKAIANGYPAFTTLPLSCPSCAD